MQTYLLKPGRQIIGRAGNMNETAVAVDIRTWVDSYPAGIPQLMVTTPGGERVPLTVTVEDGLMVAALPDTVTVGPGLYVYTAVLTNGGTQVLTERYECIILGSELVQTWKPLGPRVPDWAERIFVAADVIERAMDGAIEARTTAVDAAAGATASAEAAATSEGAAELSAQAAAASASDAQEILDNVVDQGAAQVSAIVSTGETVLQSIPAEYTALGDDVSDLKSAIGEVITEDQQYTIPELTKGAYYGEVGETIKESSTALSYSHFAFDHVDGNTYTIRTRRSTNTMYKHYVFALDDNLTILAVWGEPAETSGVSTVYEVNPPHGTKKIGVHAYGSTSSIFDVIAHTRVNLQTQINLNTESINDLMGTTYNPIVLTGSQEGRYIISAGLSVGSNFARESNQYNYLYSAKVSPGTYWLINCGILTDKPLWCAVDSQEIIMAVSPNGISGSGISCNCKIVIPDGAVKVYWAVKNSKGKSIIVRDRDEFELLPGNNHILAISDLIVSNSTAGATNIKQDGMPCAIINVSEDGYVDLPIPSDRYLTAGVWLKMSASEAAKVTGITVSQVEDGTLYGSRLVPSDRLKCGEWVFVGTSAPEMDAVSGLRIAPSIADGQDGVSILICTNVVTDFFSKPYAIINFDGAWQATEDCGAYDLLINNNIPFTITGDINNTDAATKLKLLAAMNKGLLDIGTYGHESIDGTSAPVMSSTDMQIASQNMLKLLNNKQGDGIEPVSFGPVKHIISPNITKTLKNFGYKICRTYGQSYCANAKYKPGLVCITETHLSQGQSNLMFDVRINNGVLGMFGHGVSSDPSGESDPSLYTSYTAFYNMIEMLQIAMTFGAFEPITMREFVNRLGF